MTPADRRQRDRVDHAGGSGSRISVSRDAPSTLTELVGIVLDPAFHPVASQTPSAWQDLQPRLLLRKSA